MCPCGRTSGCGPTSPGRRRRLRTGKLHTDDPNCMLERPKSTGQTSQSSSEAVIGSSLSGSTPGRSWLTLRLARILDDSAGPKARRANADPLGASFYNGANTLQVRLPDAPAGVVRVTAPIAELDSFSTDFANAGHHFLHVSRRMLRVSTPETNGKRDFGAHPSLFAANFRFLHSDSVSSALAPLPISVSVPHSRCWSISLDDVVDTNRRTNAFCRHSQSGQEAAQWIPQLQSST